MALGIAASQPVGLREQFGTMTKPFHPGGAARAGLMSALMASQGFTASPRALEAPRGLIQVASRQARLARDHRRAGPALRDFVQQLQAVCLRHRHPPQHRRLRAAAAQGVTPEQVERIELRVHSLVLELTGKKEPADGLQGKFSVYHGCAAA
jgi:2-methylcitrate dehydratase PrpD